MRFNLVARTRSDLRYISFLLLFVIGTACSIKELAVKQIAPMLSEASPELQRERNWYQFKRATPGSLQLAEVLLDADPDNQDLHALLVKGYASYAYVVHDTEYLRDRLQDRDDSQHREEAIQALSKALRYGFAYLKMAGLSYEELQKSSKAGRLQEALSNLFDGTKIQDQEAVFFTGTAWLLSANYQKDNMIIVSQISQAFELIEWVCRQQPDFQSGLCPTMQAVFHLARPAMMGGKPDLAKQLFVESIKKYPNNYLIPVTYLEWYVVPRADEKTYRVLKKQLAKAFEAWSQESFVPGESNPQDKGSLINLFNAMARQRFGMIIENEKELF